MFTRMRRPATLAMVIMALAGLGRGQNAQTLTLKEAEKIALLNNPQIAAARFNAEAAGQVPLEVASAFQPTLFGSITGVGADTGSRIAAGALNNPVLYNRVGTGLFINQLVTDFGRTSELVKSSRFHAQAQQQVSETTRAQVLLQTDRAYFAVLRAQSVLTVARQTVSARQLVADQVTALAKSNLKSQLDVSFANVNLADAKLLLSGAQNDLSAARADLATAIGAPAQLNLTLAEEPMPGQLPDRDAELIDEAIRQRPELSNLRLEQEAAQRFAQAERALALPTVSVIGTAGFAPAAQDQVPGRYGGVGVNLNIPVFNGGLFKARRSEAELRTRAAGQNVKDLENRVIRDVRVAYLNAKTAFERVGLTAQLLDQARLSQDLAQSRYDLGLSSIIELSQAQLNLTSAQIASASAKYEYQNQRSQLSYQTGSLR